MTWSGYLFDLVVLFVFGGCLVAEGAVQAGAVVPADVLDDRPSGGSLGGPGLGVDQLAFECGEEALGEGVVPALAGPAEGQDHLVALGELGKLRRGVLAAAVGVEDHPGRRVTGGD